MSQDHQKFVDAETEILAVGPDTPKRFQGYWSVHRIPFVGLPDENSRVAKLYRQQVNIFKLGRMPGVLLIDKQGRLRYEQYGHSMADIPENELVLSLIEKINRE